MAQEDIFKKLVAHCKEYGFVFQSSEIYDGLSAVYDYGQYGVELKNNIKKYWWDSMVLLHENVVGLDSAIFMHPTIWKASGHVDAFNDPLIDNKDSKKRYRADVLIEEQLAKFEEKMNKEIAKAQKRFGDAFDEKQFRETNQRVLANQQKYDELHARFAKALNDNNLAELKQIIIDQKIVCPVSGSRNWTDVRQFNLMFSTEMGSTAEGSLKVFLRPETAQGIFVNYLNVQKSGRMKIPFGIAQIGKAFRNEIVARQFIFRMREFEQMEMQFFVKPGTDDKWFAYWKEQRLNSYHNMGIKPTSLRWHKHGDDELAFYAKEAYDIQFLFPMGWQELEGIHNRTDYDLTQHQKFSKKDLTYLDQESGERFVPYVVETSAGLTRNVLMALSDAYEEEEIGENDSRTVLRFHPKIAPVTVAVLPLVKKDGLSEAAQKLEKELREEFVTFFDQSGAIGRRYRRMDEIGTPYCLTVDYQSLEDNTVTLRFRDSMEQIRVKIDDIVATLKKATKEYKRVE